MLALDFKHNLLYANCAFAILKLIEHTLVEQKHTFTMKNMVA